MSGKRNKTSRPAGKKAADRRSRTPSRRDRPPREKTDEPMFRLKTRDSYLLYGRNAVIAALGNHQRDILRLITTERAAGSLDRHKLPDGLPVEIITVPEILGHHIPVDAPHQGLFLEVRPLPGHAIEDIVLLERQKNIILMLDQVTDPQNVGACLRSAAAFGARALVTQDRNSPSESGALARASAGGLEVTPWVRAANLAQTLDMLKDMGYWRIGLDGHTDASLKTADMGDNIVIVMGSEGKGLRPLVRKHCDLVVKIPMSGAVESLNVSNAAAIALYELS